MSYKKKAHGGERPPSTVQMKRLPCRVLTDHTECWWTGLTTRGQFFGSLCEVPYSPVQKVVN